MGYLIHFFVNTVTLSTVGGARCDMVLAANVVKHSLKEFFTIIFKRRVLFNANLFPFLPIGPSYLARSTSSWLERQNSIQVSFITSTPCWFDQVRPS